MEQPQEVAIEELFASASEDWNTLARLWVFDQLMEEPTNDPVILHHINQEIWEVFAADGPFGKFPSMMWFFSTKHKIVSPIEFLYFWSHLDPKEQDEVSTFVMWLVATGK